MDRRKSELVGRGLRTGSSVTDEMNLLLEKLREADRRREEEELRANASADLDPGRVADFRAGLIAARMRHRTVERLFAAYEKFALYRDVPEELAPPRVYRARVSRAALVASNASLNLNAGPFGWGVEQDLVRQLLSHIEDSAAEGRVLSDWDVRELLSVAEGVVAGMTAPMVLVTGWGAPLLYDLYRHDKFAQPTEWEESRVVALLKIGRSSVPLVQFPLDQAHVAIVDLARWAKLIKAQLTEGEFGFNVKEITDGDARGLAKERGVPEAELEKEILNLRASVFLEFTEATGFKVFDPAAAVRLKVPEGELPSDPTGLATE
jgi:hypothetical protein